MNRKKIRALEDHVLPEKPEPTTIYIKNKAEADLSRKAQNIRIYLATHMIDIEKVWNNDSLTLKEKEDKTLEAIKKLDPTERLILSKDHSFIRQRLFNLIELYYKPSFPKCAYETMLLYINWFFDEMDKLSYKEHIIDDEWNHNRNEEQPNFDDFAWWDMVDAKIKKVFPEGVFTPESFEKLREWFEKKESEYIMQHWEAHPDEHHEFMKSCNDEDLHDLNGFPELKKRHEAIKEKWTITND